MSDRRIIYTGLSNLGIITIREGDYVEFETFSESHYFKGIAFFSEEWTTNWKITYRVDGYAYGHDDCHSRYPGKLKVHRPLSKTRTGFGKFIQRIEGVSE